MPKLVKKRSRKAGLPPGALVHIGEKKAEQVKITVFRYGETGYEEQEVKRIEECAPPQDAAAITWINIDGIHRVDIVEGIGKLFGLHPLVLEDIVNTGQRPKMEDYDDYFFIVLKMLSYDDKSREIGAEQVSLILGPNLVVSFQEREGDVFNGVRDRIRSGKGKIRKMGTDYLTYALLDAVVDSYFAILEKLGETIEVLEEVVVNQPTPRTLREIHHLKREMILLRRSVWPLREVVGALQRGESPLIREAVGVYLRDVYDHTIGVMDTVETFRDILSGMLDIYLSSISNRMSAAVKTLTIIATIFMPLTLIAGIYGMNFRHIPELELPWGYPAVLLVMVVIAVSMLLTFRKKGWL